LLKKIVKKEGLRVKVERFARLYWRLVTTGVIILLVLPNPFLSLKSEAVSGSFVSKRKTLGLFVPWTDMGDILGSPEAIDAMVRRLGEAGFLTLYWEVWGVGSFTYYTKIERVYHATESASEYSKRLSDALSRFDPFRVAVNSCRKYGLEIYPVIVMAYEGVHPASGWRLPDMNTDPWAVYTSFARQHPEYLWRGRSGEVSYWSLSYAYPEARAYRIALLKELLDYGVNGLLLDFNRDPIENALTYLDLSGTNRYGYEAPLVEGYNQKHGVDPHNITNDDSTWVQYRADNTNTLFLRELKGELSTLNRPIQVSALIFADRDYALKTLFQDWKTWVDEGLVDELQPMMYNMLRQSYPDFSTDSFSKVYEWTRRVKEMIGNKARVFPNLAATTEILPSTSKVELMEEAVARAFEGGADGVAIYSACGVYPKYLDGTNLEDFGARLNSLTDANKLLLKAGEDIAKARKGIFLPGKPRDLLRKAEEAYQNASQEFQRTGNGWSSALKCLGLIKEAYVTQDFELKMAGSIGGGLAAATVTATFLVRRRKRRRTGRKEPSRASFFK